MIHSNAFGTPFLLALLLLAAPAAPARAFEEAGPAGPSSAAPSHHPNGGCGDFSTTGTPACNGTSEPVEVTVSTVSTVQVTIGNKVLGAGVSEAHEASYTATLDPGECLAIQYNFDCCPGWFGNWTCHSTGTEVVSE